MSTSYYFHLFNSFLSCCVHILPVVEGDETSHERAGHHEADDDGRDDAGPRGDPGLVLLHLDVVYDDLLARPLLYAAVLAQGAHAAVLRVALPQVRGAGAARVLNSGRF